MKKLLQFFIVFFLLYNSVYAELPGYTCKIQGKIIKFDDFFIKPDCFKLTKAMVLKENGSLYEFTIATRYHDTCFKTYFYGGTKVQNVLNLPHFIPDYKQVGKKYFFKIEEMTLGNVLVYSGSIDKDISSKIPNDSVGEIPIYSIMSGYYEEETEELKSISECVGNINIDSELDKMKTINNDEKETLFIYKYIIFGILIGIIIGYLLKHKKR